MNKKSTFPLVIAGLSLLASTPVLAQNWNGDSAWNGGSRWTGAYAGAKIGLNNSEASGVSSKTSYTTGLEAGYLTNLNGPVMGVDLFADFNPNEGHATGFTYGTHVYGADFKIGLDNGPIMPYAKIGLAHTTATGDLSGSATGFHGGLGFEYMVYNNIGVTGEWTYDRADIGGGTLKNNNFTVGANYHF